MGKRELHQLHRARCLYNIIVVPIYILHTLNTEHVDIIFYCAAHWNYYNMHHLRTYIIMHRIYTNLLIELFTATLL